MEYNHNPRTGGRKQKDFEQVDDALNSKHTPYFGSKRTVKVSRGQNKQAATSEMASLTNEGRQVYESTMSTFGFWIYGLAGWSQVIFTIVLVTLIAAQASAALTVKVLLILILVHNFISLGLLGMHHKIENSHIKSINTDKDDLPLLRHMRNDRRSTLFLLNTVVSCIAAINVAYIGRISKNVDERADTFRNTGVNTYVHRSMDVLSIIVFALAVPTGLLILAELQYLLQYMLNKANKPKLQNSETFDEYSKGPEILSPKE